LGLSSTGICSGHKTGSIEIMLNFPYDLISCSIKKTKKICPGGQTDIANFFQAGYKVILK
jgi:hypothetical protein